MKPMRRWHLRHWEKYRKISCMQTVTSLSDGPLKENGMVPLRVQRSPVLSSLPQPYHWSPGPVTVQWRVLHGTGWLKVWEEREGGRPLNGHWLDITRQSRAVHWWGLQRGTMGWGRLLLIPVLPCLQQKQSSLWGTEIPVRWKEEKLQSALLPSKFLTSHRKSKANSEYFPYLHYYCLSTGEALEVSREDKVGITSKSREANWLTHNFAQQWDGSAGLLYMLQRCAASQQGIITQWQRWMTPCMHF